MVYYFVVAFSRQGRNGYTRGGSVRDKKRVLFWLSFTLLAVIALLLIIIPIVKVMNSSYSVIIRDREMNYFRGERIFICGDTIILKKDPVAVKNRSDLPQPGSSRYSLKMMSMNDVAEIEIVSGDSIVNDEDNTQAVKPHLLGRYKIQLQGHEGTLVLGVSKERVYGTVRFPQWGKGAVETLKGIKIGSSGIKFIRAASNQTEARRLGANYLFRQNFSGTYNSSGSTIKGFMVNDRGEKHEWEAVKKK